MSGPTPPYEWQQPSFNTPEPPVSVPKKWYHNPFLIGGTVFAAGAFGLLLGRSPSGETPREPTSSTSPIATSEPSPTPYESTTAAAPTAKPTETPSPEPEPESSSGFRDVDQLAGNIGFYTSDENDASKGVLWGRAITKRGIVNFIPISCKNGVVTAALHLVDQDNVETKHYNPAQYPKIRPQPCNGDMIKTKVKETPFEYYSVLLGRIIAKGTVGR